MSIQKAPDFDIPRMSRQEDEQRIWWQNFRRWFAFGSWAANWVNVTAAVALVLVVINTL